MLYMAPYSEWTGCGSGITKNCEWLTPKKRRQMLTGRNNESTAKEEEEESLQQENRKEFVAIKMMLYREITMRTPPYVRSHAKNSKARTNNTKRLQQPTGTCRKRQSGGNALCSWRGHFGHRTGGCEPRLNCDGTVERDGVCRYDTLW